MKKGKTLIIILILFVFIFSTQVQAKNVQKNEENSTFDSKGVILTRNKYSEEILKLKVFLRIMGWEFLTEDYSYDNKTKKAIVDYQKEKGLKPDGIVGEKTYNAINKDINELGLSINNPKIIFTKQIPQKSWLIINKSNNTLYCLEGNNVIKRYPVATGKNLKDTPEGKFTIATKYKNPTWGGAGKHKPIKGGALNNPLGKRWMGLSKGGGGVYGIHGNSNKSSIGKYASAGCIRMYNDDVHYLYGQIKKETPVWIGNEEKLEEYGIIFNKEQIGRASCRERV